MKPLSFRARLSLWNAAVLAVVLGGFGMVLWATMQARIARGVDQDMRVEVQRVLHNPVPPPNPRAPRQDGAPPDNQAPQRDGMPPDPLNLAPPPADGQPAPPQAGPPQGSRTPSPQPDPSRNAPSWNAAAERVAAIRRPRFLDLQGRRMGNRNDAPWDMAAFRQAVQGRETFSNAVYDGERLRVLSVPWRQDERIVGVVQIAREMGEYDRLAATQAGTLAALLPIALALAGAGALFLTGRALRPVRDVTHAAAQLSEQDLSRRLTVTGRDELAEMASTFNGMVARLEGAFHARETAYARLEAAYERQRRFTADASHELRTPLARIKLSASEALSSPQSPDEYRSALGVVDTAADAMTRLIQQLLLLARADAGELRLHCAPVEVGALLRDTVAALPARAVPISLDVPKAGVCVAGDADHLRRLFLNLLENAARHTPPEGCITFSARVEGANVIVRVSDTGGGIAPEHLPHLMERFYRVDSARSRAAGGSGLGLAICRSIVEAHHGAIHIESALGNGATVTVSLPAAP